MPSPLTFLQSSGEWILTVGKFGFGSLPLHLFSLCLFLALSALAVWDVQVVKDTVCGCTLLRWTEFLAAWHVPRKNSEMSRPVKLVRGEGRGKGKEVCPRDCVLEEDGWGENSISLQEPLTAKLFGFFSCLDLENFCLQGVLFHICKCLNK